MGRTIKLRVDKNLQEALEDFRKNIALDLKQQYNLDEITVHGTLASQILAAKMQGKKFINFRIEKNGLNRGTLKIV